MEDSTQLTAFFTMASRKKRRMDFPVAPQYPNMTIGSLVDLGPPPLDSRSAKYKSSAHTQPVVPRPATIVVQSNCPPPQLPSFYPIPEDIRGMGSDLLRIGVGSHYVLDYDTEADIQNLVQRLLMDAIAVLGLLYDCKVRMELSVFSLRPDIIVLHHKKLGILLVVEVKKPDTPGSKQPSVFEAPKVGGQLFDYLMGMYNMGNATPFGILSTYEFMTIAWLNTPRSNEIMAQQSLSFSSAPILEREKSNEEAEPNGSPSPLPTERVVPSYVFPTSSVEQNDSRTEPIEDDFPREILYSPRYKYDEALKATVLALRCGLEAAKERSERTLLKQGDVITEICALCHPTGLAWKKVPETTIDYVSCPAPQTRQLYLWKDLGRGSSGRALLAFSTSGRTCVVKFFHYKRSELPDDNDEAAIQKLKDKSRIQAEKERTLWHRMYPQYKSAVRIMELNQMYGIVMPYFDPVQSHERVGYLPAIRSLLVRFKEEGYRYEDGDLRWRHVGIRGQEVALIDVGSLEAVEDAQEIDVDEQIAILRDKS